MTGHRHPTPPPDPTGPEAGPGRDPLHIDCDECLLQGSDACADCVVTFLCGTEAGRPVVVELAEVRAMRLLDQAGLAPPLRHRRRTG